MKILLINKYHYRKGGAERAYFDMAEILQNAGHEVAYFAMHHPKNETTPWSKYFVSEVNYHDAEASLFQKISTGIKILWNFEANRNLKKLLKEFQPDIAHCHNIYHQLSPSIFHVLKRAQVPMVLTLHDYKIVSPNYNLYVDGNIWESNSGWRCVKDACIQGSRSKSLICALEKWIHQFLGSYHLISALISPSQFLANKVKELGWKGKDISVIPNPLSSEEIETPYRESEKVKGRLIFFGRLSEEKGIEQILEALSGISGYILRIIGEGPLRETLEKKVSELNLNDRVHFTGALYGNDLQKEIEAAEAVLIPSRWYENLPYVVTESLARGAIVIAAHSGGIAERITHGQNGFLYPLGDGRALQDILQNLATYPLSEIRKNAHGSVKDLSPKIFLKHLEGVYQNILKQD